MTYPFVILNIIGIENRERTGLPRCLPWVPSDGAGFEHTQGFVVAAATDASQYSYLTEGTVYFYDKA